MAIASDVGQNVGFNVESDIQSNYCFARQIVVITSIRVGDYVGFDVGMSCTL